MAWLLPFPQNVMYLGNVYRMQNVLPLKIAMLLTSDSLPIVVGHVIAVPLMADAVFVREFVQKYYADLKKLNPNFPIYIRPCDGVQPTIAARYSTSYFPMREK